MHRGCKNCALNLGLIAELKKAAGRKKDIKPLQSFATRLPNQASYVEAQDERGSEHDLACATQGGASWPGNVLTLLVARAALQLLGSLVFRSVSDLHNTGTN